MGSQFEVVKPLDGEYGLKREQLAKYFNRVGRGINCRMDIPVLTVEDVKWTATLFEKLTKELSKIAYHDERPDIWRILAGRFAIEQCRQEIAIRNEKKASIKAFKKATNKPGSNYD